ncbi:MAG: putative lipid II flippase FtsW [Synergistaceae bacterium]|jgi:cell division protein FtsW|nr:putative lipid II flippase FtsW [Synergistaceae bacterium]
MARFVDHNQGNDETNIRIDAWLWLIPLILSGVGILMVTSTTSNSMYSTSAFPLTIGFRQTRFLGLGFMIMLMTFCVPVDKWRKIASAFWIFSVALTVGTLIPGFGISVNGARRWLRLGGLTFQPSELMALGVVLETAKIFEKSPSNKKKCMITILIVIGFSTLPLLRQPDFGTTVMLAAICMGMFVERFGWKYPLALGAVSLLPIAGLVYLENYRIRRLNAFIDPFADPLDAGYQIIQSLIAFANGETWGTGLGHGLQKLQYLPAGSTDFIYAMLGEEVGLLGTMGVLTLFAFWVFRCRLLYKRVPDGFETSMVWGITLTILLPFFINIAGVTKLIPLTGMPLPFISYGGSAMLVAWMRIGVLLRMHKSASEAAE